MTTYKTLVTRAQEIFVKHLQTPIAPGNTPLGLAQHAELNRKTLTELLELFDGPEQREADANYDLSFSDLRFGNITRQPHFKNREGAALDCSAWTRSDWLEAITNELGEYAAESKHLRRGEITEEEFTSRAKKELADVAIYLDILANHLGIDLGEAIRAKFNEVSDRVGCIVKI